MSSTELIQPEFGAGVAIPEAREAVTDINVMVAGRGGDGSLTVVTLLSKLLSQCGFHMCSSRDVASRIKGGHAAATLRGSLVQRWSLSDHLDVVVGFDKQTLVEAQGLLKAGSVVIFDSSLGEPDPAMIPEGVRVYSVPFGRLAVRDLRRELFKNSFSFGMLTRCLNVEDEEAIAILSSHVARFSEGIARSNIEALKEGFGYADEQGLTEGAGPMPIERSVHQERLLMSGNHATAFGFLAAGGRFYAGYPITPATDIMDWLRLRLPKHGGVMVQAEDELGAVNLATGAALAGARAMVGTSSPGLALMLEGIGNVGAAEIPLVIVDTQRAGPSTGMPTKPEQSDMDMMVYGGNGEFPHTVLVPCDQADCFDIAFQATNISQKLQCPVIIALDQGIGQDAATMQPFDLENLEIDTGKRLSVEELEKIKGYRRYEVTEDGVSPWAVPGTLGGMNLVTGNERDEWGKVNTTVDNRQKMMDKRTRKINKARHLFPAGRHGGKEGAKIGVISVGMVCGTVREAVERLELAGLELEILEPRTIFPVPDETIEFVKSHDRTYVFELNCEGQLARVITAAGVPSEKIISIRKYTGTPFKPGELVAEIKQRENFNDRDI